MPCSPSPFLRSFGRRKGRILSQPKQELVENLLPKLSPPEALPSDRECWLEIGFGAGEHLAHIAQHYPEKYFVGAEPYLNGVASLLHRIADNPPSNLSLIVDDVRPWLQEQEDALFEGVYILFPDPWPKRSHKKRRIINRAMLDLLADKIQAGGKLRIATDHVDYSAWIFEELLLHPSFQWNVRSHQDWDQPYQDWQQTRYQRKTTEEGRLPIFLEFIRQA
jgi:tRNA (guanine-N7-)-methyltransferase